MAEIQGTKEWTKIKCTFPNALQNKMVGFFPPALQSRKHPFVFSAWWYWVSVCGFAILLLNEIKKHTLNKMRGAVDL